MHDRWIVAIALCTSAVGIAGLLGALLLMEAPEAGIADLAGHADGAPVRIRGEVRDVQQRGNITIVSVEQPAVVDVVVFDPLEGVPAGCVVVSGKKGSYGGEPQVVASRIMRCED